MSLKSILEKRIKELEEKVEAETDAEKKGEVQAQLDETKEELEKVETEDQKKAEETEKEEENKMIKDIAAKLSAEIDKSNKASFEVLEKKKALDIRYTSKKISAYKFKSKYMQDKTGRADIKIDLDDATMMSKWFKAFVNKDIYNCQKIYDQMQTKLEPLNETTAADGGILVPTLLANFITEVKEDASVIRPYSRVIDMTSMKTNTLTIPSITGKPYGSWTAEQANKGTSSMQFGSISLTPYKYTCIVLVTTELRDDSPFVILNIVADQLAKMVAREEDRVFINGVGAIQPTGIATYGLVTYNAGGNLTFDNIIDAYQGLPQGYRSNAYWIMNSRAMAVVRRLKDSQNDYILKDLGFLSEGTMPSILGRPVLENNNVATGTILFGDLSNYYIADKGGMKLSTSEEAYVGTYSLWQRNLLGIKVEERVDAELTPIQSFVQITNAGT